MANSEKTNDKESNKPIASMSIAALGIFIVGSVVALSLNVDGSTEKAESENLRLIEGYFGKNETINIHLTPEDIETAASKSPGAYPEVILDHYLISTSDNRVWGFDPNSSLLYGKDAIVLTSKEKPLEILKSIYEKKDAEPDANQSAKVEEASDKDSKKTMESKEPTEADSNSKLESIRKKLRERMEKGSASKPSESEGEGRAAVSDNEINIDALRETETALFYKGEKIPKLGYDFDGNKLPAARKQAQVKAMMNRISLLGDKWSVVYKAKGEEKQKIAIFSDPTCPYCQKLHEIVPDLQANGVTVYHLFYNRRNGPGNMSAPETVKINNRLENAWCSDDPQGMIDSIYKGYAIPEATCSADDGKPTFPASEHYFSGRLINMTGTPYTLTADGRVLPGYQIHATQPATFLKRIGL